VINLVTIGGPNMGVDGVPHCPNSNIVYRTFNSFVGNWVIYSWLA